MKLNFEWIIRAVIVMAIIGTLALMAHSMQPPHYSETQLTQIARVCGDYWQEKPLVGEDPYRLLFQCMQEYGIGFSYYSNAITVERAQPFR